MQEGLCLRIYLSESDSIENTPVLESILELCQQAGLKGVSVFRGIEGLGKHGMHSTSFLALSSHLPIVIEAIDSSESVTQALPSIQSALPNALIVTSPIHIIQQSAE